MNYTELKQGEIYYCDYSPEWRYIMRENKNGSNSLVITKKTYSKGVSNFNEMGNRFREATPQEIEHFLQCEKANKYVEYIPIIKELLIFN